MPKQRVAFVVLAFLSLGAGSCGDKHEPSWRCLGATYLESGRPSCMCGERFDPGTVFADALQLHDYVRSCQEFLRAPDVLCCSFGSFCECSGITCGREADGCVCDTWSREEDLVGECEPPAGGHCCALQSTCRCGDDECEDYETEVESCTPEVLTCGYLSEVESCLDPDGTPGGGSSEPFEGCAGFRQTDDCSADGPRQPCNDHACTDEIPADVSGYCECGEGRVDLDCGHPVQSCEAMCGAFASAGSCVAWRHTGDYRADGPRQPENDRACNSWIATDWSGFCECDHADVPFDSFHAPFSCETVCAGIPVDPAHCEPPSTSGGEGGGCSGNSDCGDCERCELSTGNCVAKLSC